MAYCITRAELQAQIAERQTALDMMTDATRHFVCPACLNVRRVDQKRPARSDLHCWCDYESQEIER